ncbi:MAG TPA: CidA/LrgA family protein [Anaeromyxobacter sp.]
MLSGFAVLLSFQLAGEVLSRALRLPVPGPVIGMALLLGALELRGSSEDGLRTVANGLLSHLSLLFVPAGVGVILHASRLAAEWLPIAVSLVASTAATLAVTGWLAQRGSPRDERGEGEP